MPKNEDQAVTEILGRWDQGDPRARAEAVQVLYDELRRIATDFLRSERPGHTLQATAVVNEAYLRLIKNNGIEWQSRAHFLGIAARTMRQVLVDHSRCRNRAKRGGDWQRLTLSEIDLLPAAEEAPDLLALDDALLRLASADAEKAAIVEARFFGGLTVREISEFVGVSIPTVNRQLRRAKAWLYLQLSNQAPGK